MPSSSSEVRTSASQSFLDGLDAVYPEKMGALKAFEYNTGYTFTLSREQVQRQRRARVGFQWNEDRFRCRGRGQPEISNDPAVELLEATGRTYRLLERVARGGAQVISRSRFKAETQGKLYNAWAYEKHTLATVIPCLDTLRDAAECMAEILLAAIEGYDRGYQGCLWAILHQSEIYSHSDPGYEESLALLHEWTKKKYEEELYMCKLKPSEMKP